MIIRALPIGLATTLVLVALLAVSRMLSAYAPPVIELAPVEIVEMADQSPPPDFSEPDTPDDPPPPPAPKIEIDFAENLDAPEIALSLAKVDLTTPIEAFQTDVAPADLPIVRKAQPKPVKQPKARKAAPPRPKAKPKKKALPKPKPKKSYYNTGELDGKPRQIRTGKFKWPSRAKGARGSVRLLLEINEAGRVSVVKVVSSSDPALTGPARKVARGSRFTAPRKGGQKVKARFYKTYHLQKP